MVNQWIVGEERGVPATAPPLKEQDYIDFLKSWGSLKVIVSRDADRLDKMRDNLIDQAILLGRQTDKNFDLSTRPHSAPTDLKVEEKVSDDIKNFDLRIYGEMKEFYSRIAGVLESLYHSDQTTSDQINKIIKFLRLLDSDRKRSDIYSEYLFLDSDGKLSRTHRKLRSINRKQSDIHSEYLWVKNSLKSLDTMLAWDRFNTEQFVSNHIKYLQIKEEINKDKCKLTENMDVCGFGRKDYKI